VVLKRGWLRVGAGGAQASSSASSGDDSSPHVGRGRGHSPAYSQPIWLVWVQRLAKGRDIALRCPRPRAAGGKACNPRSASERRGDSAARRPHLAAREMPRRLCAKQARSALGATLAG